MLKPTLTKAGTTIGKNIEYAKAKIRRSQHIQKLTYAKANTCKANMCKSKYMLKQKYANAEICKSEHVQQLKYVTSNICTTNICKRLQRATSNC